jgi:ABC-type multidrug transport system fused ATPase/permease subunit
MKELLETFSLEQTILFVVLLCFAIKEIITFADWATSRVNSQVKKANNYEELKDQIQELNTTLIENLNEIHTLMSASKENQEKMQATIDLLIESDKDDIKSWITEKHHYFCYEKGYIDDYNLDCMEKRYKHYISEHGNSFVGELMNEVRALPKVSKNK